MRLIFAALVAAGLVAATPPAEAQRHHRPYGVPQSVIQHCGGHNYEGCPWLRRQHRGPRHAHPGPRRGYHGDIARGPRYGDRHDRGLRYGDQRRHGQRTGHSVRERVEIWGRTRVTVTVRETHTRCVNGVCQRIR